jgi:hypothetical protein
VRVQDVAGKPQRDNALQPVRVSVFIVEVAKPLALLIGGRPSMSRSRGAGFRRKCGII